MPRAHEMAGRDRVRTPRPAYAAFATMEREGWIDAETAHAYADGFAAASAQHVPHLVRAVYAGPGTRVLDLCCGHGIVAEGLVAVGADVTALDFSPVMLAMARERVPEVELVEGDAPDLPFADASFDAVAIGLGIPHMPDPDRVLAEARRVLRDGGRIAFTCWLGPDRSLAMRAMSEAIARNGDPDVSMPEAPSMFAFAEESVVVPALARADFGASRLEDIDSHWVVDKLEAVFDLFMHGTVRVGEVLQRQPEDRLPAIRQTVADALRDELGHEGPWRVPVPAAMASAKAAKAQA